MKLRLAVLAALALTAAPALSQVVNPRPWTPPAGANLPDSAAVRRGVSYVDGVPDTGQFLPDSTVLARVDDRIIRVRDYREGYFSSLAEYRPRGDSLGRVEFLRSMVNKEVLALTALAVDKPFTFEDRAVMREHTQRALSNVVFQRLVMDSAQVTEEDLRRIHRQMGFELRLERIAFRDRDAAERVRADLVAGRVKWKDAHAKHSIITSDGPGGDIGWTRRATLEPLIAWDVYETPVGRIAPVVHDAQGYHVVRVTERREVPSPAFEAARIILTNMVGPIKISRRIEEVRAQVRSTIGWTTDDDNIHWVAERIGETQSVRQEPLGPVIDLSGHVPDFPPADTARVLARWNGGHFTLGMFLAAYADLPLTQRQNVNNELAFRHQLETFALEPHMAELARRRGLENDPLAKALILRKKEELLLEHLFSDSVLTRVRVTDADRERYYRDHYAQFHTYQTATYAIVHRWTRAGADSVIERLRAGERAADILRADSLRGDRVLGAIRTVTDADRDPYQKLLFEQLRPGEFQRAGPFKDGDYEVVQLLEIDHGRQLSINEVMDIVDESVRNIAAERALESLIERQRRNHDVAWSPEIVMRIKLADPLLD